MFRPMRRKEREITAGEAWQVVREVPWGVLSLAGEDGYPYGVPLSHAVMEEGLVFHIAPEGHKLDALRADGHACYTVVQGPMEADPSALADDCLGTFRSVVLFGRLVELPEAEYGDALRAISAQRTPKAERAESAFTQNLHKLRILRLEVDHLSGKKLLVR